MGRIGPEGAALELVEDERLRRPGELGDFARLHHHLIARAEHRVLFPAPPRSAVMEP
jgi:hypothetical protein